jgi:molecular chaperone GrpE
VQNEAKQEVDEVTSEAPDAEATGQAAEADPAEAGDEEVEASADAASDDSPEGESPAEAVDDEQAQASDDHDGETTADAEAEDGTTAEAEDEEEEDSDQEDTPVTAEHVSVAAGDDEQGGSEAIAADLASLRSEAAGYLDDLRRLQAEFDNYRKRMLREQTNRVAAASQALVSRLLPVLDNFELAISSAEQSRDFDRMLKGVEMVFGELREVLRNEGLSAIEAEGKPFDPGCHEAVVAVEEDGAEAGTVLDVVRTGYEFQGKVLRPAMVKVAK